MRRGASVLHPFFFAAFPVLFLFQHNRAEVTWGQVWLPLVVALGFALVLLLLALALFRGNGGKASLAATAGVALFFSYGHVREAVKDFGWGRTRFVFPFWILLGALALVSIVRATTLALATRLANTMGIVLVATTLAGITLGGSASSGTSDHRAGEAGDVRLRASAAPRDVWYLVFDRYASNRSIHEVYGSDNSPFLDALRERDFYVAEDARANYVNTIESMASSLNLEYLDDLTAGARGDHWGPVRKLIQNHEVGRALKALGYTYFHIGSWSEISRTNALADTVYQYDSLPEFTKVLWDTTMLRLIDQKGGGEGALSRRQEHRAIPPFQFRKFHEIARMPGPKFVLGHVLLPHRPYVFDAQGKLVTKAQEDAKGIAASYVEQMRYTNKLILDLVDDLLDVPAERRPIIVIAADEGPYPARWQRLKYAERTGVPSKTPAELRLKFQILQTLYLPGVDPKDAGLSPAFSPVNQFRVVFNEFFGTDLPLLPDRSYIFPDARKRYDFDDITDEFDDDGGRGAPPEPA